GRGLMNYGETQIIERNFALALTYFNRALAMYPDDYTLQVDLGMAHGALNDDDQAESHFRKAIDLAPHQAVPHFCYAQWLAAKHRTSEAIEHLNSSIRENPSYLDSHYLLMEVYSKQHDREKLEKTARYALSLFPGEDTAKEWLKRA